MAKLYLVHCGFYDGEICDGLYESHVNFFVAAASFEEARKKAKEIPEFQKKKMHVDGLQEIQTVDGFSVSLKEETSLMGKTTILNFKHRDLAPKKPEATSHEPNSQIDPSLVEHSLSLSHEQRIESHESALQLVRELQKAGQEYYAREPKSST